MDVSTPLKILCAIDGSPHALEAVKWVAHHLDDDHTAITLLHVIRMTVDDGIHNRYGAFEEKAHILLAEAASLFPRQDNVARDIVIGIPGRAIVQYARDHHADLLVLGHTGHSSRLGVLGSTLYGVLHATPAPLLVGPPHVLQETETATAPLRVLLATDGSSAATMAAHWLDGWAAFRPVTVGILNVLGDVAEMLPVNPLFRSYSGFYWTPNVMSDMSWDISIKEAEAQAQDILASTRKLLPHCTIEGAWARTGLPVEEILAQAQEFRADLIVMGRRGHSALGTLLGSVSFAVMHQAPVPVVVVGSMGGI
ncbi:MAG: universal stress protein [Firmicutes bacterium]|nr:universal stress protein [Bacillota bacterium]